MNPNVLEALIQALAISPDNVVLRVQVVEGLLRAGRAREAAEQAPPLMESTHQALAVLARAHAALEAGDRAQARELYAQAIRLEPARVDEGFEARLEPDDDPWRVPTIGEDPDAPQSVPVHPDRRDRITLADVGGMEPLKEQIRLKILYPFQQPHVYAAYGKKIGGGILMYGPPGCGKTYLARATAGELGARFYVVTLEEVLNMWMGQTEKQLHRLFETARGNAPAVLFIDEVDALGAKRSEIQSTHIRIMVSQFLVEMDGIAANNEKLLVLGATNVPWNVDPALRRPGRFDRVLFVPPPDLTAREEILKLHARGRKIADNIPWRKIAENTELFSGADLSALVELATEGALAEALRSGRMHDVTPQDFTTAAKTLKPSTVEWLRRAKNYVTYSNADGSYDDVAQYLSQIKMR